MDNNQKAKLYDEYVRESDILQRENSKIKSEHTANIPPNLQMVINRNNERIAVLVGKLEKLFN